MLRVVKFTAKEIQSKGFVGMQGGVIRSAHYGIEEVGKGLVSLDGKIPYLLGGKSGRESMEIIVAFGGFVGQVRYIENF